jgi:CheY-like chemotaxis protein
MSAAQHILIVDDNEAMARTLRDIIELKGISAAMASSGRQAIQLLAAGEYSCIISDIRMPEMNGLELYRAVRARYPWVRVLLMTAYVEDELIDEGLAEGVIAVLSKPLDIPLLLSLVG